MRDLERLRDVVEYRVSPGQLRLVFLGGLAAACAIFAVGVSVGKRLEPGSAGVTIDPLAELNQLGAAQAPAKRGTEPPPPAPPPPALTYHDELMGQNAARPHQTARPQRSVRGARPAAASEESGEASAPAPADSERETDALDENVAREPARPEEPEPGEQSIYTLQVASFPTRDEARTFAEDLRSRGHRIFLVQTSTPDRGTWYRVRVGPFHSRTEATDYQSQFERRERIPAFLVRRRP